MSNPVTDVDALIDKQVVATYNNGKEVIGTFKLGSLGYVIEGKDGFAHKIYWDRLNTILPTNR